MPLVRIEDDLVVAGAHIVSVRRYVDSNFHETVAKVTLTFGPTRDRTWTYRAASYEDQDQPVHDSRARLAILLVTLAEAGVTLVGLDEDTHVAPAAISSLHATQYPPAVHVHFADDSVSWTFNDHWTTPVRSPYQVAVERLTALESQVAAALAD